MRRALLIAALVGGCHFSFDGSDGGLTQSPDDAGAGDFDDGFVAPVPPDLGGFVPSHVDPGSYHAGAADLPLGITAIDTSALTLNGAPPPAGVTFAADPAHSEWAVLSVGAWTIDKNIRVSGTRALVVVAAGKVDVAAVLDASADHLTAGPGATVGGKGGDGITSADDDGGGGGGGFGSGGAQGGDSTSTAGGAAGITYGKTLAFFGGGSPGGAGGGAGGCNANEMTKGRGGGGGGAVQISSAVEVTIEAAGGIHVSGGGGTGGCGSLASAAGGGGSGGLVFLESPSVTVLGKLAANGGGGGGAGSGNGNNDGKDGANGTLSATQAAGGQSGAGGILTSSNGGNGGKGAAGAAGATRGDKDDNGGGSGGGSGRIWLRSPEATTPVIGAGALLSPSPMIDGTL